MKKIAQFLRHRIGIVSISVTFLFLSSAARNCDKKEQHDFKPEINCDDDTEKTLRIPTFPSPICIFDNFYFQQFPDFCTNETSFIIIYSCCLEQLNTDSLNFYPNLECIDLSNNRVTTLHNETFKNSKEIKKIYLTGNKIEIVERHAFAGLKKLEILDLSNNKLQSIDEIRFEDEIPLQILRLNGNRLNSDSISKFFKISEKHFLDLKELGLSNNKITSWSNEIVLSELIYLRLNHNDLQQWSSCKISQNLKELDLSYNSLTSLDSGSFEHCPNLVIINLRNNYITSIEKNTFENLRSIKKLNLKENRFSRIDSTWFTKVVDNISGPEHISRNIQLTSKRLECDCNLFTLQEMISEKISEFQKERNSVKLWTESINCKDKDEENKTINLASAQFDYCPPPNGTKSTNSHFVYNTVYIIISIVATFFFLTIFFLVCISTKTKHKPVSNPPTPDQLEHCLPYQHDCNVVIIESEGDYMNVS